MGPPRGGGSRTLRVRQRNPPPAPTARVIVPGGRDTVPTRMTARPHAAPSPRTPFLLAAALPVLLGSCGFGRYVANGFQVGPDYATPAAETATEWVDREPAGLERTEAELTEWWKVFGDPVLDGLVAEAVAQNLSLKASLARVAEVSARLGIAQGNFWPQEQAVSGSALATKASGEGRFPVPDQWFRDWQVAGSVSWELDLWGRYRRAIESAEAELQASQADHDDATVLLVTEVAANFVRYRTSQERLTAARENVTLQEQNLAITEARFEAGAVSRRDVEMAKQVLAQTRAYVPAIESDLRFANNALCLLLGRPTVDLAERLGATGRVPELPVKVAIGMPADLLRRRPDVRAAERQLAAQSARIGIAESDMLPHLALTGALGVQAASSGDLLDTPSSLVGFIGPSFRWDVLNYGRFENNVIAQEERYRQLEFRYRETVLAAGRETEDAIADVVHSRVRAQEYGKSRDAAASTLTITTDQYNEGTVDFLSIVYFSSTLAQQSDAYATARGAAALSLVRLYRTLGGGWKAPAAATN